LAPPPPPTSTLFPYTTLFRSENSRWEYDDLPYWGGEVDCCINAFTLANGTWLGADVSSLPQWFVDHQMDEGGWNCEWVEGSTRRSEEHTSELQSRENLVCRLL